MAKQRHSQCAGGAKQQRAGQAAVAECSIKRDAGEESAATARGSQVEAVVTAARRAGLLEEKSVRIGGRVCPALVDRAKARTGIQSDTDLIEYALAPIALEDGLAESFKAACGTVDSDLKLGF